MNKLYSYLLNTLPRPLLIRMSYVFRWFSPLIYAGNKVECPVCGKTSRKFLPYGSKVAYREGVLCPHDLTLERHRLMWLYLKSKSNFFTAPQLEVLHIAPEQCFLPYFKKQANLTYLTGDLESPIADMHFDLHDIPLGNDRFDVVFCNHVLEHVQDDHRCMSELFRVMKPGGWGIFQVPLDTKRLETYEDDSIVTPEDREIHYWQKDHVRLFGMDYPVKMQAVGFEVETYDPKVEIPPEQLVRYCLDPQEILYIFRKPVK